MGVHEKRDNSFFGPTIELTNPIPKTPVEGNKRARSYQKPRAYTFKQRIS